jgi:periplasmic protein TonB
MTANALWQQPLDGEHRRHRHVARVLKLAPAAPKPVALVVPAEYQLLHEAVKTRRPVPGLVALVGVAIALHAVVFWAIANARVEPAVIPPEVPQIEVVLTPPRPVEPPPVAQPEPPKPAPKQIVKKMVPKPAPKPMQQPVAQDVVKVPPPLPVQAAPAPVVETVTEPSADADYLQNPAPNYPSLAQRQGWEGTVWLNVFVKPNGLPGQIELQKTSGRKTLDDAAITAVRNWRFVPAKRGKTPVEGWVSVPIEFSLNS